MAKFSSFEEIIVWQQSKGLVTECYKIFRCNKDYSFRDQIQRACISVMNNIAEGFERKGNKEFIKFLYISKGSCGEVRSMLYIARELKYISEEEFTTLFELSFRISKMLACLIKTL